jgi:hypothetical protein
MNDNIQDFINCLNLEHVEKYRYIFFYQHMQELPVINSYRISLTTLNKDIVFTLFLQSPLMYFEHSNIMELNLNQVSI